MRTRELRFSKPAYSIKYFSKNILTKCPKCEGLSSVSVEVGSGNSYSQSLYCQECGFVQRGNNRWFGFYQGFINFHCGFCGERLNYCTKPFKKTFEKTSFRCPKCEVEKSYPLKWYRCRGLIGTEPYFGLELWLKVEVKDNILWVYNAEHLRYIRDYVVSKLREDDERDGYSIISKLPKWIKSAKSRDLILKKLKTLEKML